MFFGVSTRQDIQSLVNDFATIEQQSGVIPNRLIDLRQVADMDISYGDILGYAEAWKARTLANPFKCAIVASLPVHMGFARMYQTLQNHPQIEVQIFPTAALAEAWLAER